MNKQKHLSLFGVLTLTSLLTACPPAGTGTGASSSPSAASSATPTPGPVSATVGPEPSGAPLTALPAFPQQHLICCWDALVKQDSHYPQMAVDALNGKLDAVEDMLKFAQKLDLNAGYAHGAALAEILVRIGDDRFSYVLRKLDVANKLVISQDLFPESMRENLRNLLEGGFALNSDPPVHMKNLTAFPETAKVLKYVTQPK